MVGERTSTKHEGSYISPLSQDFPICRYESRYTVSLGECVAFFPFLSRSSNSEINIRIWNPNVYSDGRVCISILHLPGDDPNGYELASERWMPVHTVCFEVSTNFESSFCFFCAYSSVHNNHSAIDFKILKVQLL